MFGHSVESSRGVVGLSGLVVEVSWLSGPVEFGGGDGLHVVVDHADG